MTASAINPAALPSLPLEERKRLPGTAAIYFVLSDDTVLYVGKATNLYQRWDAHHRLKQLNEHGGCRIAWMTVDDAGLLDEMERACIAHFEPVLNREAVPGGSRTVREGEVWVTARIPEEAKARLEAFAEEKDLSASHVMRRFLLYVLADPQRMKEAL